MNLSELLEGLDAQAEQVHDVGLATRLASVQDRVRVTRRRRLAGAVGVSTLGVVAVTLAVALGGDGRSRGDTPIDDPEPTPPPIVETNGAGFATRVGSMNLVEYAIARPIEGRVVLNTEVPTTRVRVVVWCFGVESEKARTQTDVSAVDMPFPEADEAGRCTATRPEAFIARDAAIGFWRGGSGPPAYVIRDTPLQGGPISLDIRLLGDSGLEDARLAVAIYAVPRPVATVVGLELFERWYDGQRTRSLLAYGEDPEGSNGAVVQIPSSTGPIDGYYAYSIGGSASGTLELLVDGQVTVSGPSGDGSPTVSGSGGGAGELALELPPGEEHEVELRIRGAKPGAVTLGLVFYTDLGSGLR